MEGACQVGAGGGVAWHTNNAKVVSKQYEKSSVPTKSRKMRVC